MATKYQRILLAVELNSEADDTPIHKAVDMAKECGATLTLVHAVEHMGGYGAAYGVAASADIEAILLADANGAMKKLGEAFRIDVDDQIVKVGPAKSVILDEAERLNADLIIVGSHGRSGIRLLLGSTANAVLHGATCDVLAVRVKEN